MTETNETPKKYDVVAPPNHFYFVETCEKFQQNATTEHGCGSLQDVYDYLTEMNYPEYVKDGAITEMGFDDIDYRIKITLLEEKR